MTDPTSMAGHMSPAMNIPCPLCSWHLVVPEPVVGPLVENSIAVRGVRVRKIEGKLEEHLREHSPVDWLTKMNRMSVDLERANDAYVELTEVLRQTQLQLQSAREVIEALE